jgi:hypothetical protein
MLAKRKDETFFDREIIKECLGLVADVAFHIIKTHNF